MVWYVIMQAYRHYVHSVSPSPSPSPFPFLSSPSPFFSVDQGIELRARDKKSSAPEPHPWSAQQFWFVSDLVFKRKWLTSLMLNPCVSAGEEPPPLKLWMTTSPLQFASSLKLANPSLVFVKIPGLYLMWQGIHVETACFEAGPPCLPLGGVSLRT